jgi:hypothetical protein
MALAVPRKSLALAVPRKSDGVHGELPPFFCGYYACVIENSDIRGVKDLSSMCQLPEDKMCLIVKHACAYCQ